MSLADSGFRNDLPSAAGPSGLPTGRPGSVLGGPGHLGLVLGAGVEAGAVVLAAVFTTQLYRRAFLVIQLLVAAALALGVTAALQLLHGEAGRRAGGRLLRRVSRAGECHGRR